MPSITAGAHGGIEWLARPAPTTDPRPILPQKRAGLGLAAVGLAVVVVAAVGNLVAASDLATDARGADQTLAWTFGVNTAGFALIKLGIAVTLVGILRRLWLRVEAAARALARIHPEAPNATPSLRGDIATPFGAAQASSDQPPRVAIHKMAHALWLPMVVMGAMAVALAAVFAFVQADQATSVEAARWGQWTKGVMFLGETFLLAGISFLLGTILAALREGGAEVQARVGVTIQTLKMPRSAKAFVGLMMVGVMIGVVQFVASLAIAGNITASWAATWIAWITPLRELGLGVILAGIVLALFTISKAIGFQFHRLRDLVTVGA